MPSELNLIGRKFNKLLVLEKTSIRYFGNIVWKCQCDCGNIIEVTGTKLNSLYKKSCGCSQYKREMKTERGSQGLKRVFDDYKSKAKKKHRDFELTIEDFNKLTKQNCYYCSIKPSQIYYKKSEQTSTERKEHNKYVYNGIDRIDNSLGYTITNTVSCCGLCNNIKRNLLNESQMKEIGKLINKWRNDGSLVKNA